MSIQKKVEESLPQGYIHKWLFRTAIALCASLFFIAVLIDGFQPKVSITCPAGSPPCKNLFYACANPQEGFYVEPAIECNDALLLCERQPELCANQYLQAGEVVGERTSLFSRILGYLVPLILGMAFAINHLLWRKKQ